MSIEVCIVILEAVILEALSADRIHYFLRSQPIVLRLTHPIFSVGIGIPS